MTSGDTLSVLLQFYNRQWRSQPVLIFYFYFALLAPQHVKCLTKLMLGQGKYLQNTWHNTASLFLFVCSVFCSVFLCSPSVCEIAWNFKINISSQTFQKSYFIANNLNSPTDRVGRDARLSSRDSVVLSVVCGVWYISISV